MDIARDLNEQQYIAATHKDGPLLVLAGAGSGKTRVLTYRIAYLVGQCKIKPWNILAITFTNKAANEMRERISMLLDQDAQGMWINTFHSACGKILRAHAGALEGYNNSFTIYDEAESISVIKECQRRLNIDNDRISYKTLRSIISSAKDEMLTPEAYAKIIVPQDRLQVKYSEVYTMYQEILRKSNAMDFDDMILNTIILLKNNKEILEYYQNKFRYILVDEYQDTNKAQHEFVKILAEAHSNLCVVGDDDQSIYSFRGAEVRNILDFEKEYPSCKVVMLEQNYRSTQNILGAANAVIQQADNRHRKVLWTDSGEGEKVVCHTSPDSTNEVSFIVNEIRKGVEYDGMNYRDYCILYRVNALSQAVESFFMRQGIPYKVYGGLRFFDRKEIKDFVAYLRLYNNPLDDSALRRIVNTPKRGIGDATVMKATDLAAEIGQPLFNILLAAESYTQRLGRSAGKMSAFASELLINMMKRDEMGVSEFVEFALESSGLMNEYLKEDTLENQTKIENLKEFISVAKNYEQEQKKLNLEPTFGDFLENISLSSDVDRADPNENAVTLMTVHSAKGLEFPVVFIIGMEEGLFPSARSMASASDLDEERRLCYVAITRAREKLYITNASSRMLYGKTTYSKTSRFLQNLPGEFVSMSGTAGGYSRRYDEGRSNYQRNSYNYSPPAYTPRPVSSIPAADVSMCRPGMTVRHKKFGRGIVLNVENPENVNATVEINFERYGMKRLVLRMANLEYEKEN